MGSQLSLRTDNRTPFTVLDLFSGAGGMALGFEAAGGKSIGAVEHDTAAAKTFKAMFPEANVFSGPEEGDMRTLKTEALLAGIGEKPDIVVGGPPCQGFSRIGRAKRRSLDSEHHEEWGGHSDRSDLYKRFRDVVQTAQPLAFVMENVPAMREHADVDFAKHVSRDLHSCGYNIRYFLLNSAWYGVPQIRWRLFFVGFRSDLGTHAIATPPTRTHLLEPDLPEGFRIPDDPWMIWGRQIETAPDARVAVNVWEALQDLPRQRNHLGEGPHPEDRPMRRPHAPSDWAHEEMLGWPGRETRSTDEVTHNWYRSTPRDYDIFRLMAHSDRYPEALAIAYDLFHEKLGKLSEAGIAPKPGTEAYKEFRRASIPPYRNNAFDDKWRKLDPQKPAWTVTAHLWRDGYSHIHYRSAEARTISIREAARLQSFPDGFQFSGNHGDAFKQIGNAVPPLLARAVAEQVFSQLREIEAEHAGAGQAVSV